MELRGRWGLVTGAARRIDRSIALALAERGLNVIVHYNASADAAAATVREIEAFGVRGLAIGGDLARGEDVARLAREAEARSGGVDVLVNNASNYLRAPFDDLTEAVWDASPRAWTDRQPRRLGGRAPVRRLPPVLRLQGGRHLSHPGPRQSARARRAGERGRARAGHAPRGPDAGRARGDRARDAAPALRDAGGRRALRALPRRGGRLHDRRRLPGRRRTSHCLSGSVCLRAAGSTAPYCSARSPAATRCTRSTCAAASPRSAPSS